MNAGRGIAVMLLVLFAGAVAAAPAGSAFTYQGELQASGAPANGSYDMQFALFAAASGGSALDTLSVTGVAVDGGRFAALLDFTAVPFESGEALFLELRLRSAGSGSYQTLLPRQTITPAPYALSSAHVMPGGVDQAALAPAAVGSVQLAPAAVGTARHGTARHNFQPARSPPSNSLRAPSRRIRSRPARSPPPSSRFRSAISPP